MSLNDKTKVFEELYYVSRETIEKLLIYEKLIIDAQEKYNLVGKSTLNQVWLRHFADSAKIESCSIHSLVLSWEKLGTVNKIKIKLLKNLKLFIFLI